MGTEHTAEDDVAFFAATLAETVELAASAVAAQTPDAGGPLPPGRYLIQVLDFQNTNTKCWVRLVKFVKSTPAIVAAAVPNFPMSPEGVVAIEVNIREGHNDRLEAITQGGNATVYATRISYGA